jgi:hypothetical protein
VEDSGKALGKRVNKQIEFGPVVDQTVEKFFRLVLVAITQLRRSECSRRLHHLRRYSGGRASSVINFNE